MIVISYRRADSAGFTRALRERLVQALGAERVFLDVEMIEAGVDYRARLRDAIAQCDSLLVVIGPDWLTGTAAGGSRLDQAEDPVRLEIATALETGRRVIPVLVEGARMPGRAALPEEIRAFADHNALELSNERFDEDVERLLAAIGGRRRLRPRYAILGGILVLIGGAGAAIAALVPRPEGEPFTLVVRVTAPDTRALADGSVAADLGRLRRRESIDAEGKAVFVEVPAVFVDSTLSITAAVPGYDTLAVRVRVPPDRVVRLSLVRTQWVTPVRGRVTDAAGQPMADVLLEFDGGRVRASTDGTGAFTATLPVPPGEVLRLRAVRNDTVGFHDTVLVPEREPLAIRFIPGG